MISVLTINENVGVLIHMIDVKMRRIIDKAYEKAGLTMVQGILIGYLANHRNEEITPNKLSKDFHLSKPTITGLIQRMAKKEMIVVKDDKQDHRCKTIKLSAKGEKLASDIRQIIEKQDKLVMNGISNQQQTELKTQLNIILSNIRKETNND